MTAAPRIGALVLAAGASTRLGSPKQLIIYQGAPLVRRAAIAAVDAGATQVVVVLGANESLIRPVLQGLASVTTIMNADWASGMSSSLAAGLRALNNATDYDAVLVTLADQPLVDAAALKRLIAAFDDGHRLVASAYDKVQGVPAVFGREHVAELMQLAGDAGAGRWLRSRSSQVTSIPMVVGSVDIDTPADETRLSS